ncbi:MAG: hypothetical protein ACOCYP_04530 [Planctomycetota bacterium]
MAAVRPDYPNGVHARVQIEDAEGRSQPIELAIGPADTLGDLHDVLLRFCEAYCLGIDAEAFSMGAMRLCLFDPDRMVVAFDEDDEGRPDPADAMDRRFAFAFIALLGEIYDTMDPWLVVRPCTRDQVAIWQELMGLDARYRVAVHCLDERLERRLG